MKIRLMFPLVTALVACGARGPETPAATQLTTADASSNAERAHHEHEHQKLAPALHAFHEVISPVWHSDAGTVRVAKACASVSAMSEKGNLTGDAELAAHVATLEAACAKPERRDVESALAAVHDRFHALAKMPKHEHH